MLDEGFGNATYMQQGDDQRNVAVLASVVVPKEPYSVFDTEVIVDEEGQEGICLIVAEGVLGGPDSAVFRKPMEVMVPQVYACADGVQQEWVAFVECQDVRGLKEPGFEDGDICCLEACLLMEAVFRTGASEGFSEEGMW
jgi:hypothetical protein